MLSTMGSDIEHCGDIGSGQVVKIMNNMVLFQTVAAISEAFTIAERNGVSAERLLEVMSKGSGDSFALRNHGAKSLVSDTYPERAFSVRYAAKDLSYALEMAQAQDVPAGGAAHVARLFEEAIESGDGERYFPVIKRLLNQT